MWISECVEWCLCQRGLFSTSAATWMFTWRWIPCFLMSWCLCLDCVWPSFWLLLDSGVLVSVTARVSVPVTVAIFCQQTYQKVVFFNCWSYTDFFFFFWITKYSFILGMWFLMTFSCVHRHMKKALLYLSGPTCLTSGIHISPSLLTDMWVFFFLIFIFLSFFLYSFIYIWSACLTKFINRNASHFSP